MSLVVKAFPVGARIVDAVTPITAAQAMKFKAGGIDGVVQYANTLTTALVAGILAAKLGLTVIGGYADKPDVWMPTAALGRSEAQTHIGRVRNVGWAQGAVLWCDVETPNPGATAQAVMDYGNAWATEVIAAGYLPGVYVGANTKLSASQLYSMRFVRYWQSLSSMIPEPACGWCMRQLYPDNQMCLGVQVDYNFAQQDYRGRSVMAVYAA